MRVLPEDAPVMRATPGNNRVEDMASRLRRRADDVFKGECHEFEYLCQSLGLAVVMYVMALSIAT